MKITFCMSFFRASVSASEIMALACNWSSEPVGVGPQRDNPFEVPLTKPGWLLYAVRIRLHNNISGKVKILTWASTLLLSSSWEALCHVMMHFSTFHIISLNVCLFIWAIYCKIWSLLFTEFNIYCNKMSPEHLWNRDRSGRFINLKLSLLPNHRQQARKLQDAQAEKLTSLQAEKLTC